MIGKCRFSFGGEEKPAEAPGPLQQSCHLDVLRSDRRLAEVEITNPLTGDQLRVMLVRAFPKMKSGTEKAADEAAGKQKLGYRTGDGRAAAENQQLMKAEFPQKTGEAFLPTSEEISMYLHASEDENPIHQGKAAVVPGFLMVNRILEGYGDCIEASVRFYLPLQCQEPAELVEKKTGEQSRTVELFTDRGRILQMKLQGKGRRRKTIMNITAGTMAKKETIWTTFGITTMALMTTMLIVSTYIKIPLPFSTASITAQTLVVNLVGLLFAPLQIVAIMTSWILLNVLGIGGSLGKLLGPTGGYRYGFAAAAILTSLFCRKVKNLKAQTAFLVFAGIPVIYLFGAVQMKAVTKQPWQAIMVQAVLPFIPLDVVKCFVAAGIAKILRRVVPQF